MCLAQPANRAEVARRVCAVLQWRSPGGAYAGMSARVALLRLHRLGLITLPPPRSRRNNENRRLGPAPPEAPPPPLLSCRVDQLGALRLHPVGSDEDARQYRRLLQQYHYLGYSATAGAQRRYLIVAAEGVLGATGFGAAAWKVGARDAWIGWDQAQRCRRLHLVINHTRFLILPWVRVHNLGSKVLALAAQRVGADFRAHYGYAPVLLESFVEYPRFTGGVYRAANWQCVGHTRGRGRNSTSHAPGQPVKSVWVYPLCRDFRSALGGAPGA
ncbi:MAG: DUF4338 domain-containing protein [Opitutaceae bacterium]|nr:DUF4338 domain-containing protein [Opitutaceae bacterium]